MELEKSEDDKLGFLLDSLHNRIKSNLIILTTPFVIEAPKLNKYGYIPKNGCKSKKELRAWILKENKRRKAEA